MKAIDLYGGVGGWSLGLRMAGIKVVRHYEWWEEAVTTYNANFDDDAKAVDIRKIDVDLMRKELRAKYGKIDIVVGSPPCTQFSYSNRGGGGDLADGLRDITCFLDIVRALKPKYWAMENVPRAAQVISAALEPGKALAEYNGMISNIIIVDAADFGVPQNRKRMIAGNFPANLFTQYKDHCEPRTLGDVISGLSGEKPQDPVYGQRISAEQLTDNSTEESLSSEEVRLNREAKEFHPVYNKMAFPDKLDRPSRTITATCTRVSRESIVIAHDDAFRRLTIRERASAQSFPISFQFLGASYSSRIKMVGNAMPPLLAYYIASGMREIPAEKIIKPKNPSKIISANVFSKQHPVALDRSGSKYQKFRRFRAAVPGLRFGSGVRFDLLNEQSADDVRWKLKFYFGPSKDMRSLELSRAVGNRCWRSIGAMERKKIKKIISDLLGNVGPQTSARMQDAWALRKGEAHPHAFIDSIGLAAKRVANVALEAPGEKTRWNVLEALLFGGPAPAKVNQSKFKENAIFLFAGIIVGSHVNTLLNGRN